MEDVSFKHAVREYYAGRARMYDQDREALDPHDFRNFDTVIPYLVEHSGSHVLEVATGTGIVLARLIASGKDAFGLDLSPDQLNVAQAKPGISADRLVC